MCKPHSKRSLLLSTFYHSVTRNFIQQKTRLPQFCHVFSILTITFLYFLPEYFWTVFMVPCYRHSFYPLQCTNVWGNSSSIHWKEEKEKWWKSQQNLPLFLVCRNVWLDCWRHHTGFPESHYSVNLHKHSADADSHLSW